MELNLRNIEIILSQNASLKSELDATRQVVANQSFELEETRRAHQAQSVLLQDAQAKVAKLTEEIERLRALQANSTSGGSTTRREGKVAVGPPPRSKKKRRLSPPPATLDTAMSGQENDVPPILQTPTTVTKRPLPEVVITQKPPPATVFTVPDTLLLDDEAPLPPRRKVAPMPRAAPLETISVIQTSRSTSKPSLSRGQSSKSTSQNRKVKVEKVEDDHPSSSISAAEVQGSKPTRKRKKMKDSDDNKLPPDVLADYLATTTTYEISPPPSTLLVPRKFLRLAYGGSDQHMSQIIQPNRNPSGTGTRREVMFPNFDMHPAAPSLPGVPGLYFEFFKVDTKDKTPYSLFCKPNPAKAVWMYLGEYKNEECEVLTPEKFRAQRQALKTYWGRWILDYRSAAEVRARIALRKTGAMPDADPLRQEKIDEEEAAIRGGRGVPLDEQDVIAAFENGDESIYVTRMQCIGYDETFMKDIEAKWPTYGDLCAQEERDKKAKAAAKGQGRKRKTPKGENDAEDTLDLQNILVEGDEGTQDTEGT